MSDRESWRKLYREDAGMRAFVDHVLRDVRSRLYDIGQIIHELNREWWQDPATGQPVQRNVGEMLMLIVSELGEAMEAHRTQKADSHLPHRPGLEVELADALIRLLDLAAGIGMDLPGAAEEKLKFNLMRRDHDPEERAKPGGKKV